MGFGTHPHDNMEIITIPLRGDLEHKDSMGNAEVTREGEIQVMSAGTGVYHSEYNKNADREISLLQLWIFPNQRDVAPRYDQIPIDSLHKKNEPFQILSPNPDDQGVWIHQNAWFHMLDLDAEHATYYDLKSEGNGVYAFVIEGEVEIGEQVLGKRDALGITKIATFEITAHQDTQVLLIEVPLVVD
jgi:redox-sensitive bicupin YhaK (pirin superfamily)